MVRRLVPDDVHQRIRIGDSQTVKRPLRGLAVVSLGGREELAQNQPVCLAAYERCIRAADREYNQHGQRREAGRRLCTSRMGQFSCHESNLKSVCRQCQIRPTPAATHTFCPEVFRPMRRSLFRLTNASPRGHLHNGEISPDGHYDTQPGHCPSHRSGAGRPSPGCLRPDCRPDRERLPLAGQD